MSKDIFGDSFQSISKGINFLKSSTRYSVDKMENSFRELYGENVKISDIKTNCRIFVTCATQNKNIPPQAKLIRNYENKNAKISPEYFDCKIWEAARATSGIILLKFSCSNLLSTNGNK
jgi:hypothetical protein